MGRILVVDDEPEIAEAVAARLRAAGHEVTIESTGHGALTAVAGERPDLVVLDLTLPDLDGIEVCRRLHDGAPVPVLMLTARDNEADIVLGLEVGADDYLTKPFSPRELLARVRAILRRIERATAPREVRVLGELRIDVERRVVTRSGASIHLTPTEFDLLGFLAARDGAVFSRLALLAEVWGYHDGSGARTVDSHVRSLRQKLGAEVIRTVHGVGYAIGTP